MQKIQIVFLLIALASSGIKAQPGDNFLTETQADKQQRMQWWRDARFGLFLHWGIYAVAAGEYKGQNNYGEWLMYEAKIPVPEYEKFAAAFNPVRFDADAWVRMARDAGMRYIVITSKHHDGFCMFDSKVSDYDIIDRTTFKRDPMDELAQACRKYDLKLCFYYSIMDWHHPDAAKERFAAYRDNYLKPQLRELLTRYGDIGVLWFDGEWIDEWTEAQGRDLYNFVRQIQPGLIVNNRVGKGRNGMQGMNTNEEATGDFGTPEQEVLSELSGLDWESCMTMNDHWGYNQHDNNYKSAAELIWNIADVTAKGGNYLLNIGPTAAGEFPEASIARLQAIGAWTQRNARAIYGAKTWTHWKEGDAIRYTQGADGEIFAFVRNLQPGVLRLKKIQPAPRSAVLLLGYDMPLEWTYSSADGVEITLPAEINITEQPVWAFQIAGQPVQITATPRISPVDQSYDRPVVFTGEMQVTLEAAPGANIYYTLDGKEPDGHAKLYSKPIRLCKSGTVKAVARISGKPASEVNSRVFTKADYGLTVHTRYADKYAASGPMCLVDGEHGSTRFTDGKWLGFEGENCVLTIDLGKRKKIHTIGASFLRVIPSWIFLPEKVVFETSDDGVHFQSVQVHQLPGAVSADENEVVRIQADIRMLHASRKGRYVRITATNIGACPSWHPGAGAKSWLFIDEVWVK